MKYTVSVNESKRTVTVDLNGYKGVAKCCPTDHFDLTVGVELALERAKVAEREAKKKAVKPSLTELVRAVEQALPAGQMVVIGAGKQMTEAQKQWLRSLTGGCCCSCHDDAISMFIKSCDEAYEAGYEDGYATAKNDYGIEDDDDEDDEWEDDDDDDWDDEDEDEDEDEDDDDGYDDEEIEAMAAAITQAVCKALGLK